MEEGIGGMGRWENWRVAGQLQEAQGSSQAPYLRYLRYFTLLYNFFLGSWGQAKVPSYNHSRNLYSFYEFSHMTTSQLIVTAKRSMLVEE